MSLLVRILNMTAIARRATAIGLLAATVLLAWLVADLAYGSLSGRIADVAAKREQLGRMEAIRRLAPIVERSKKLMAQRSKGPEFRYAFASVLL